MVHGDLKPANVLMTGAKYDVKLSDFGISQILKSGSKSYDQAGTLPYCSPEVLVGDSYDHRTDVWALGCILYELCTHRRCFDHDANIDSLSRQEVMRRINVPQIPEAYGDDMAYVYSLCMAKEQRERPQISDILALPAVRNQAVKLGIYLSPKLTTGVIAREGAVITHSRNFQVISTPHL